MSEVFKAPAEVKDRISPAAYRRLEALAKKGDRGTRPEKGISLNSKAFSVGKGLAAFSKDLSLTTEFLSHYMDSSRSKVDIKFISNPPEEWQDAIARDFGTKPRPVVNTRYAYDAVKLPDMKNSLGHFDLFIDRPKKDVVRYVIVDRYDFPDRAEKTSMTIKNGKKVGVKKGDTLYHHPAMGKVSGKGLATALRTVVGTQEFKRRESGTSESLEYKDGKMVFPQRYLEDYGIDFLTVIVFERQLDSKAAGRGRPER